MNAPITVDRACELLNECGSILNATLRRHPSREEIRAAKAAREAEYRHRDEAIFAAYAKYDAYQRAYIDKNGVSAMITFTDWLLLGATPEGEPTHHHGDEK